MKRRVKILLQLSHTTASFVVAGLMLFFAPSAFAQLNENCTVSILNRTAKVKPDGSTQRNIDDDARAVGREPASPSSEKADWKQATELLKRKDQRAILVLRELFQREEDKLRKQQAAMLLLVLGEPDEEFFEFLAGYAQEAVEINMPFPREFDKDGKPVGEYSQEFLAWCKDKKVRPQDAARKAVHLYPTDVMLLGRTGDPRGFTILLQGLDSPNYLIVAKAAFGLALIGDKRAIGPIYDAARRFPNWASLLFAQALVHFENNEAQALANTLIKDES